MYIPQPTLSVQMFPENIDTVGPLAAEYENMFDFHHLMTYVVTVYLQANCFEGRISHQILFVEPAQVSMH